MTTGEESPPELHPPIPATPDASRQPDLPIANEAARSAVGGPIAGFREARSAGQAAMIGVMTTVAFVAISSITVLRVAGDWAGVLPLLTLALLGVSLIGILHRRGARRAFWQGFAILGLGYFVLAFVPSLTRQAALELPTSRHLRSIHARAMGPNEGRSGSNPIVDTRAGVLDGATASLGAAERPGNSSSMVPARCDIDEFVVVGHCWFTLLAALFGSAISIWFHNGSLAAPGRLPRSEPCA